MVNWPVGRMSRSGYTGDMEKVMYLSRRVRSRGEGRRQCGGVCDDSQVPWRWRFVRWVSRGGRDPQYRNGLGGGDDGRRLGGRVREGAGGGTGRGPCWGGGATLVAIGGGEAAGCRTTIGVNGCVWLQTVQRA